MNRFIRCAAVSCAVLIPVVAFADQPNSFAARWERGGVLRLSEGKRTVRINLSEDFVGCLGELYDPTTRKRFGRGEGPNKVLDVTEAEGHRFILLTALAAPNCNVQGQCGAGDANVTLIWLNLAPDLSVVAKKTFTVADCVAPRWVDQDDPDWPEKLAFVDGVLTINFTEVGKRIDTGEMDDISGRVSYDRKTASAGFSVTRSAPQ